MQEDTATVTEVAELLRQVESYTGSAGAQLVGSAIRLAGASSPQPAPSTSTPLIDQAMSAAGILAGLRARAESVAAALLANLPPHDCPQETIRDQVGPAVAALVEGVRVMRQSQHLSRIGRQDMSERERHELYHALVETIQDPQLVLIELAHQLNALRQVGRFDPAEQVQVATDALQVYAPLAHRLGIWRVKWELEDRAFRLTNPDEHDSIAKELRDRQLAYGATLDELASELQQELAQLGIEAQVAGRTKHIYSIHRKMQRKGVPLEAIYDIRALRVLVPDIPACYQVLGAVHRLWAPIANQFDDYIAVPKSNGYQSLHTAVWYDQDAALEVQIRTHEMHEMAELGVAAHWRYKEQPRSNHLARKKKELETEQAIDERISWLRSLLEDPEQPATRPAPEGWSQDADSRGGYIFVFTPVGDMVRLPAGSTPIDFAYRIHTELGHRCAGAKVNGDIVPLNHQLATGDRVEIVTRKRGGPNIAWLSLERGFVRTREAQKKIGAWFKRQSREKDIMRGHEILDRELAKLGLKTSLSFEDAAGLLKFERTEEMLAQIGAGVVTPEKISSALSAPERPTKEELALEMERELVTELDKTKTLIEQRPETPEAAVAAGRGLQVASTDGLHAQLARCCYPLPPEEIVGYVTRGHGVTIHLRDCPNVRSTREQDRIVPASWGDQDRRSYQVMVVVEALNRRGLMADIGRTVAKENIDISEARVSKRAHWALFELLLEVSDADQLNRALLKLEGTKGVRTAYRRKG